MTTSPYVQVMPDGTVKQKQYLKDGLLVDITSKLTPEQAAQAYADGAASIPGDNFNGMQNALLGQAVANKAARDPEMAAFRKANEVQVKLSASSRPLPASHQEYEERRIALAELVWKTYEASRYLAYAPDNSGNNDSPYRPLCICYVIGGIEYAGNLPQIEYRVTVDFLEKENVRKWVEAQDAYRAKLAQESAESQRAEAERVTGPVLSELRDEIARLRAQVNGGR